MRKEPVRFALAKILRDFTLAGTCLLAAGLPALAQEQLVTAGINAWNSDKCEVGDCSAAHSFFVQAAEQLSPDDPARPDVLGYVVRAALRGGSNQIAEHLWSYYREGRTVAATNYALTALTDPEDRYHEEAEDLFLIMAIGLSMQTYDPATFPGQSWHSDFEALKRRTDIGPGVAELLAWHERPDVWSPATFSRSLVGCDQSELDRWSGGQPGVWDWWNTPSSRSTVVGVSRREVGRGVIAQLGAWYLAQEDLRRADAFLCVAALIDRPIMTYAFRDLVWTYVDAGLVEPLRALEQRYDDHFHNSGSSTAAGGSVLEDPPGDSEYLQPIEDAYNFHPWWTKKRYNLPGVAVVSLAVCRFAFKRCGAGGASGQVVITIP